VAVAGSDLGAIVRACGEEYCRSHRTTAAQRKAMRAIGACRTPALGGTRQQCDRCGHEHIQWHSCRNRACPRCQVSARRAWLDARSAELLSVPYFHVVFTVPEELNVLALHVPRVFYDLLFRAVGATLTDIARTRLKAQIGALCVLHTWGQTLTLHPHIHCVIPGGGFSAGRSRWLSTRKPTFFLPVRVLSRRFRTLLCAALREAWRNGQLKVPAAVVADQVALDLLLACASAKEWVVYAKAPFGGPAHILGYLANYTHRIAISNSRIVSFNGQHVGFRYRDYAHGNQPKIMSLTAGEFLRRFLLHVVPRRFVRIRYYGFMANRVRTNNLNPARELIGDKTVALTQRDQRPDEHRCPRCGEGFMRDVDQIDPATATPRYEDSS
jgi:hypothetical protein